MDEAVVAAYLDRIGAARPARPDADALRELQLRHLHTVPFENLSIHLGEQIVLDEQALLEKVVTRRRGGFCYELNGGFAALLSALGYEVTLLAARVLTSDGPGPLFDHLVLRVDLAQPWLVDVGFGSFCHHPLRLDLRTDQPDPAGVARVVARDQGDLDVLIDGQGEYRIETRPRVLADFEPTCWWHRTSPKSHFTRSLTCSRLTDTGRVTLSERRLIRTGAGGRNEQLLGDDAAVLAAYRREFGIVLDRVPALAQRVTGVAG